MRIAKSLGLIIVIIVLLSNFGSISRAAITNARHEMIIARYDSYDDLKNYIDAEADEKVSIIKWAKPSVNTYSFVKGIFSDRERAIIQEKAGTNRVELEKKIAEAHAKGFKAVVMEYEPRCPDKIKEVYPDWGHEQKAAFLESKVYEIFKILPDLDGYMVTLSEGDIWSRAVSKKTTPDAIMESRVKMEAYLKAVSSAIARVERETGQKKLFFFRTWLGPGGPEIQGSRYFSNPPLRIPAEAVLVHKLLYRDVMALNPSLFVLRNPVLVELDVSFCEYRCRGIIPIGMAGVWRDYFSRLPHGYIKGFSVGGKPCSKKEVIAKRGVAVNPKNIALHPTPWRNLLFETFYRTATEPQTTPYQIYYDWAEKWYGRSAADCTAEIMVKSEVAFKKGFNVLGINGTARSIFWPLKRQQILLKDFDNSWVDIEKKWQYNQLGISEMLKEKDEALAVADQMLGLLNEHRSDYQADDFADFKRDLLVMRNWIVANRYYWECYFRYCYWETLDGKAKKAQAGHIASVAQAALQHFNSAEPKFFGCDHTELFTDILVNVGK